MKKQIENPTHKIGQETLELAVSCRFITQSQEEEILPKLFQYPKNKKGNHIARFLIEEKILPEDKVRLLFSIKAHMDTLMADKKFGRLGVANEFVSSENVQKALDLQVAIFRKKQKSVKIGDILVNNKEMSAADKTAVLLTQDRIKDELLAEALNTIAGSEIDRIAINKRFGAIAVKKELITKDQLNQALKVQKKEEKDAGTSRYLGEILKELFDVSDKDIVEILKLQKKFEVKRINLEENLEKFNSNKESTQTLDSVFEYHVSDDRLNAYVKYKSVPEQDVEVNIFMDWLSLSGITNGLRPEDEIQTFLSKKESGDQFQIAAGIPPVLPEEQTIEFSFDTQEDMEDIPAVLQGDLLAKLTPGKPGQEGIDVFGRPVVLPDTQLDVLVCGEGVARKGDQFVAAANGIPRLFQNRTLFVVPAVVEPVTKKIQGDIAADIDEPDAILKINGNILSNINVVCRKLYIQGDVLGNILADEDIDIQGSVGLMPGDGSAPIVPVTVRSGGAVSVSANIMNAKICGANGIKAVKSDLISSHAASFCDMVFNNIVSSKEFPSVLSVGTDESSEKAQLDQTIEALTGQLHSMECKDELDRLSKELMTQVQIQNGYLEKQNVIIFLIRILEDSQWQEIDTIAQKVQAFEARKDQDSDMGMEIIIPVDTKAHKFMEVILGKTAENPPDKQRKYLDELYDNITGIYKAAVKVTQRISKKYDARSTLISDKIKQMGPDIEKIKQKIEKLAARRDYLQLSQEDKIICSDPVIKIKNKVAAHTVVKGKKAQTVIDKDIHGVVFKEDVKKSKKDSKIIIEGYFE